MLINAHCYADDYLNKTLMIAANTAIVLDWAQTRYIANNPQYYEKNPFLGDHPTIKEVNRYFIGSLLLTNLSAHFLPDNKKSLYYGSVLVYEMGFVYNNHQIGIQFEF